MRHGDKVNALGRTKSHRDALLKNMAASLIFHKRITTTLAKAKSLRIYIEPLITRSKSNTTHSRRVVFSYLQNKEACDILFSEISEKIANRPGGYLRIIKTGRRKSDATEMAMIEFVDYNEIYSHSDSTKEKSKSTRRSRRKKSDSIETAPTTIDQKDESTSEETLVENLPDEQATELPVAEAAAEETENTEQDQTDNKDQEA